ncbi:MAG: glycosyltransferase [Nostocales cyanobacterium 94392]|nr:glycosyltransferase [Nostocales cyanobacterium 94392]
MKSKILGDKKIKVIHSYPIWLPQTQTWMYNQVRYLTDDIESHIVCERTDNLDQFWLPNIHCLNDHAPKWRSFWDKGLRKLKLRRHLGFLVEVAKSEEASILHSHFGQVGWANLEAARQSGLKHIVTFYGEDVNCYPQNPLWHKRFQQLFDEVNLILCEGSFMAQCIVNLGCPAEKVKVHHLGVNLEQIKFKPRVWNPNETLRVLIAASFREKKGIPYGLEALGKLQQKVHLEITIIGDARSGDKISQAEKKRILETIDKFDLCSKTRLLGYQPHKNFCEQAYKNHVFLSPSVTAEDGDTEGGAPVSIIENIATGMPVISTTHCDIPEVSKNSVQNLLAPERDVDGLVAMFNWLINYPDQWKKMLEAGREYLEQEYDARKQGQRLANIYQSIIY